LLLRDRIGMDNIAWECDYPHTDTTWPESPEFSWNELQGAKCTDDEIHKITWQNACRFFDWDPFEHTPKEQATVGALRALATDGDPAKLTFGMEVELAVVPFRTEADGTEVLVYAFAPVEVG